LNYKGDNKNVNLDDYTYDLSYIKIIVENWKNSELDDDDLVEIDGYKVRLIDKSDIFQLNNSIIDYDVDYWAMYKNYCYYSSYGKYFVSNYDPKDAYFEEKAVRPVINLKKEKIDNINDHQVGDIVSYKDNNYYIIKISDENYVTLFKKDALTQSQVNKYGEAYLTTYNNALTITNMWVEKFKNDLVEINGKKSGLLTLSDLFEKFGYDYCLLNSGSNKICKTDLTPTCLDSDYWYWITDDGKYSLSEDQTDKDLSMGPYVISWNSNSNLAVRPMLNVKKCSIEGGCYDEKILCEEEPEITVDPEEKIEKQPEKEKTIIEAENTFKTVSYILIIVGSLLIIGGYIFYKRIKKEVK